MAAALFFQGLDQTPAVRDNNGAVPVLYEVLTELKRAPLDTAGMELRENLKNFHSDKMG